MNKTIFNVLIVVIVLAMLCICYFAFAASSNIFMIASEPVKPIGDRKTIKSQYMDHLGIIRSRQFWRSPPYREYHVEWMTRMPTSFTGEVVSFWIEPGQYVDRAGNQNSRIDLSCHEN